MKAMRFEMLSPTKARRRFLLISFLVLVFAVLGHLVFAQRWPNIWRLFEVAAVLSAPLYLAIGVMAFVREQRSWEMIVGTTLSAIACACVGHTLFRLIQGAF